MKNSVDCSFIEPNDMDKQLLTLGSVKKEIIERSRSGASLLGEVDLARARKRWPQSANKD
jgi:hypothetical protein